MLYLYLSLYFCSNILFELPTYEIELILFQIDDIAENIDLYKTSISDSLSILNLQTNHASELLRIYNTNSVTVYENELSNVLEFIFANAKASLEFLLELEKYLLENMNNLCYNIDLIEDISAHIFLNEKAADVLFFDEEIFYDMISQIDIDLESLHSILAQSRTSVGFKNSLMQNYLNEYFEKHCNIIQIIELCKIQFSNVISCSNEFSEIFEND